MKRALALAAVATLVACAADTTNRPNVVPLRRDASASERYLGDRAARRAILEHELVNPENGYSRLRLDHYATGDANDWDLLPEYNPPAAPMTTTGNEPLVPLAIDARARAGDPEALRALGEVAFFHYPVQTAVAAEHVIDGEAAARRWGLWVDGGRIGGLVRVRTPDGMQRISYSCATCHAGFRDGKLTVGVGNDTLDIGGFTVAAYPSAGSSLLAWGRGRIDVTTNAGTEPVRIPDLRVMKDVGFLHHTASVAQNDVTSLAVRLETLVIVSNSRAIRPPREVTLGLAYYLWSLEATMPLREPTTDAEKRGATSFATHCAKCHVPPTYSGKPVPIGEVGTDGHLGASLDRGTGTYRVPSLRGLSTRGPLLHDASISTPDELLDPARLQPGYRGRQGGPVVGHLYGVQLSREERADLGAFLKTL